MASRRKLAAVVAVVLAGALVLASCGNGDSSSDDAGMMLRDGGRQMMDSGQMMMDAGQEMMDNGQAMMDAGQQMTDRGQAIGDNAMSSRARR